MEDVSKCKPCARKQGVRGQALKNQTDGCVVCASALSKINWTPKRSTHLREAVVSWSFHYVRNTGMNCTNTKDTLLYRSATCNGWKLYSPPMDSTQPHATKERPTAHCLQSLSASFAMSRWRMADKGKTSVFLLVPAKRQQRKDPPLTTYSHSALHS